MMAKERKYSGIGVSPGVAMARVFIHRRVPLDPPRRIVGEDETAAEWARLVQAKAVSRHQLQGLLQALGLEASGGEGSIFEAHMMTLDDETLISELHNEIFERRHNAEWAVHDVATAFADKLRASGNALFADRAGDILDVARRMLRALMGAGDAPSFNIKGRRIVVAENLTPSEALALPRDHVVGVALDKGGMTSHAALLVRALGIPAVFGLGDFSRSVAEDAIVALDGNGGTAVISPDNDEAAHLKRLAAARETLLAEVRSRATQSAVTPDGIEVTCLANIEAVDGISEILASGAEGVGLFRTEYLWLSEGRSVNEERQTASYAAAAKALGDRPLAIRAFDLGGDKFRGDAGLVKPEENPFLGVRSIRFLLANEAIFKVQIRALLRASADAGRRLDFTLPMISDLHEVLTARALVEACAEELRGQGLQFEMPRVGIMVEVPSAALTAHALARHCDYFSLGTNDLTQYTLAVDRCNEAAASLYQPLHPAVLRLARMAVRAARDAGIGLSACGEMAGDPLRAVVLLGLGVTTFSMAPSAIPLVKETLRRVPAAEAARVSDLLDAAATAAQIRHCAQDILARCAPEILKQC